MAEPPGAVPVMLTNAYVAVDGVDAALKAIDALTPDVLISDVGMAGRDGYDLIRSIRRLPPGRAGHVPAIALSAFARDSDRREALEAGYDRHVAKPVEFQTLVAALVDVVAPRSR